MEHIKEKKLIDFLNQCKEISNFNLSYNSRNQLTIGITLSENVPDAIKNTLQCLESKQIKASQIRSYQHLDLIHLNPRETDFLYQEIFKDCLYLRHNISIKDDDIIVDVGSNIGLFALFVNQMVAAKEIILIDPAPKLCQIAELNCQIHSVPATVYPIALGSIERQDTLTYYPNNTAMSTLNVPPEGNHSSVERFISGTADNEHAATLQDIVEDRLKEELIHCQVCPLDTLIARHKLSQIDLLKIDVERSELDVLQGISDQSWAIIKQVVIEAHDRDDTVIQIEHLLKANDFNLVTEKPEALKFTDCVMIYGTKSANKQIKEIQHNIPMQSIQDTFNPIVTQICQLAEACERIFICLKPNGYTMDLWSNDCSSDSNEIDDPLLQDICQICMKVFKNQKINAETELYALGGSSLMLVHILALIQEKYGPDALQPEKLFTINKVKDIANLVRAHAKNESLQSI